MSAFRLQSLMPTEQELLGQIVDYLRHEQTRGRVSWFARLNSGGTKDRTGRFLRFYQLYLAGQEPISKGRSDLEGQLRDGRYFALEVKKPGGKVSPEQKAFLESVRAGGGIAEVVYGYADVPGLLFGEL